MTAHVLLTTMSIEVLDLERKGRRLRVRRDGEVLRFFLDHELIVTAMAAQLHNWLEAPRRPFVCIPLSLEPTKLGLVAIMHGRTCGVVLTPVDVSRLRAITAT